MKSFFLETRRDEHVYVKERLHIAFRLAASVRCGVRKERRVKVVLCDGVRSGSSKRTTLQSRSFETPCPAQARKDRLHTVVLCVSVQCDAPQQRPRAVAPCACTGTTTRPRTQKNDFIKSLYRQERTRHQIPTKERLYQVVLCAQETMQHHNPQKNDSVERLLRRQHKERLHQVVL